MLGNDLRLGGRGDSIDVYTGLRTVREKQAVRVRQVGGFNRGSSRGKGPGAFYCLFLL